MTTRILLAALFSLVFFPLSADGMPLDANHRFEGKVTVIQLTNVQAQDMLRENELNLNEWQTYQLYKESGVIAQTFICYNSAKGANDCTCGAENRALMFDADHVEIPHKYLVPSLNWLRYLALAALGGLLGLGLFWRRKLRQRTRFNTNLLKISRGMIFKGMAGVFAAYVISYLVATSFGRMNCIEIENGDDYIFSFHGPRRQMDHYFESHEASYDEDLVKYERALMRVYWPLIKMDRLMGHYHILDTP